MQGDAGGLSEGGHDHRNEVRVDPAYLFKRGGLGKMSWQKRFFKLESGRLYWYATKNDKEPKGSAEVKSAKHSGCELMIELHHDHKKFVKRTLKAHTAAEANALAAAVKAK